jgi:hypothetical protein
MLDGVGTMDITKEDVERAKNEALKGLELTLRNSERVGLQMSEYMGAGDWRLIYIYRDALEKITVDDVKRVAKYYFKPSNRTIGVFIPEENPDRVKVPESPDVDALVKNYKGRAVVAQGGGSWADMTTGAAGQTVQTPAQVTLSPSQCYTFEILDEYGDGICCSYGNGAYSVTDALGTVVCSGGAFASSEQKAFKTGVLGLNELETIALNVYPNPTSGLLNISFEANNADFVITLTDLQGRVISSKEMSNLNGTQLVTFSTENVASGSYIVTVASNGTKTTKNVVVR